MDVQMKDGLPAVSVRVDDRAVTGFGEFVFAGDFRRHQMKIAERFEVFVFRLVERFDMLARNDQNVRRGLRVQVFESDAHIVFINRFGLGFALDNFTKNTLSMKNDLIYLKSFYFR